MKNQGQKNKCSTSPPPTQKNAILARNHLGNYKNYNGSKPGTHKQKEIWAVTNCQVQTIYRVVVPQEQNGSTRKGLVASGCCSHPHALALSVGHVNSSAEPAASAMKAKHRQFYYSRMEMNDCVCFALMVCVLSILHSWLLF